MGHKFVPLENFVRAAQTQCEFITKEAVLGFLREDRHSDGRPRFEERLGDDGRSASFRATKSSRFFANSPSSHISAPQVSSRHNLDQISKSLSRLLRYEHKSGLALESVVHHLQKHFKQIDRATVLYVVSTSRQGDTHRFGAEKGRAGHKVILLIIETLTEAMESRRAGELDGCNPLQHRRG